MKHSSLFTWIRILAAPAAVMACGLILLISPDSASGLLGRILGWGLILGGLCFGASALAVPGGTAGKVLAALVCLVLGGWLLRHPLALAKGLGRFLGILLSIRGVQELVSSRSSRGKALSAAITLLGLVLVFLPMTTSRVVFSLCGLLVLLLGIGMLLNRLRRDEPEDPNIIDAL